MRAADGGRPRRPHRRASAAARPGPSGSSAPGSAAGPPPWFRAAGPGSGRPGAPAAGRRPAPARSSGSWAGSGSCPGGLAGHSGGPSRRPPGRPARARPVRASSSGAARTASVMSSRRVRSRTAARTWVESVRWVVRSRTSPASFSRARARSRSRSARRSTSSRSRKSPNTLWQKPGSSRSRPSAYLKSIRHRTASAASRSDRSSRNCSTLTVASCASETPGRPSRGYQRRSRVRPQAVEPVPHPHRRRPGRVAGPRHPRGQLRDLDPQAGTDRHLVLLRDLAGLMSPQDWPRASLQSAKYQDSRQSQLRRRLARS